MGRGRIEGTEMNIQKTKVELDKVAAVLDPTKSLHEQSDKFVNSLVNSGIDNKTLEAMKVSAVKIARDGQRTHKERQDAAGLQRAISKAIKIRYEGK